MIQFSYATFTDWTVATATARVPVTPLTVRVAAVLLAFGARGRAQRIGDADDELYDTLASLLEDVNDRDPKRAFLVRVHLGNQAGIGVQPDQQALESYVVKELMV